VNHDDNRRERTTAAFRCRAQPPIAPRRRCQHDWIGDRRLRLFTLCADGAASIRKAILSRSDPLVATLEAFGIYAVGFVARPVGAANFGHFGDRLGRKATLIVTLLLMGISTFLVAVVPDYAAIGIWGAVILTVLPFLQGIGLGGEWGGATLIAMEWARTKFYYSRVREYGCDHFGAGYLAACRTGL
jgi:MFS family permease